MKKEEISYEQLVVGLLLKFGSVDVDDISLLMNMMGIDSFSSINRSDVSRYIKGNNNGRVVFNMDMVKRNFESIDEFYFVVENYQGDVLKKYLEKLDLLEFVLRKIKMLGNVNVEHCDNVFSKIQLFVISELCRKGCLVHYLNNDDCIDYKITKLTKKGELYLFLIDNKELINDFCIKLRSNGYNDLLIEAFLIAQDLEKDIEYIGNCILTIDNFLEFCNVYGIYPNAVDERKIGYSRIRTS